MGGFGGAHWHSSSIILLVEVLLNKSPGDHRMSYFNTSIQTFKTIRRKYPLEAAAEIKIGSTGLHFRSKTLQHQKDVKSKHQGRGELQP